VTITADIGTARDRPYRAFYGSRRGKPAAWQWPIVAALSAVAIDYRGAVEAPGLHRSLGRITLPETISAADLGQALAGI
jgi:hypothetical protein